MPILIDAFFVTFTLLFDFILFFPYT